MERGRIGVFDSGVGGLGVWREIVRALPDAATVYWADQAHVPYGGKPEAVLFARAQAAVRVLREHGAEVVVVACNTATAVSLAALRRAYPEVPFVGMEPAVKPAAAATRTGVIGVLATRTTLEAPEFRGLLERHAGTARVVTRAGVGLVEAVEAGETRGPRVERLVAACVTPLRVAGADHLVLGCTHYPFLRQAIRTAAGTELRVVDPAPAVARRTADVWRRGGGGRTEGPGGAGGAPRARHLMLTSGDPASFERSFRSLVPGAFETSFGFAAGEPPADDGSDLAAAERQKT